MAVTDNPNERKPGGAVFGMYPSAAGTRLSTYATDARLRTGYTGDGVSADVTRDVASVSPQRPLPMGVKPSTAGAGRGSMGVGATALSTIDTNANAPQNPTDQRLSTGTQSAPDAASALGAVPSAPSGSNVTRVGNSYSGTNVGGDISINGAAPGGGTVSTQNMRAADTLAAVPQPAGVDGASVPALQAPVVRHSGNDWAARKALENAATSASSITNRPEWQSGSSTDWRGRQVGGQADPNGAVAAYLAGQRNDLALQSAQPGVDVATMNANAGLQREGIQQAGANARAALTSGVDMRRLAMEQTTQGFANRAAAQQETLRSTLLDPNATPQQRQSARQALLTISGKQDSDPYLVVPGGQHVDPTSGKAYNTPSTVFNRQTGQFVQQPAQGDGLPQGMTKQVGTSGGKPVYEDASGKRYVAG
jgi:hypothetical protein